MEYIGIGTQSLLVAVFGWAAVWKVLAFGRFRMSVAELELVPPSLGDATAVLLVGAEFACAITVALPPVKIVGLGLTTGLLLVFCGAIALQIRRGSQAQCACFGRSGGLLGWRQLIRNALLVVVALAGLAAAAADRAVDGAGVAIAVFTGLVGAAWAVAFDDLAELFSSAR
jgi:methylamine utilization protein MauE